MEVKWSYIKSQLEAAVKFISANNKHFNGQDDAIREAMLDSAKNLVKNFPDNSWTSTMGYHVLLQTREVESVDSDSNEAFVEFWVDPGLSSNINWTSNEDLFTEVINTKDL